jgi:arylsulfatase
MMVPTPNIDSIAKEGVLFTDHYAQPSCTPGRAARITGQLPICTGLTTVGIAGSPIGLDGRDPTLAEVLKEQGYRTGQFGKNHFGDRNEHMPKVHGFDELRQPVPPQHRGGAGTRRLAQGPGLQRALLAARRARLPRQRRR